MGLKYSAHLDTLLKDLSVSKRIKEFSQLNFPAYELWCWWNYDIEELVKASKDSNIKIAAICTKFISLTDPFFRNEYIDGIKETIEACKKLGCKTIISQVGKELPGKSRQEQKDSIITGLKEAASILKDTGIVLVIEPLNSLVDHAGYFLTRSNEAAEIVNAVDSESIKMLFDIYHQQITEGNLIPNIKKYLPLIGHLHLADHPGRFQPGTGEINYPNVLAAVEKSGYKGYIGLECSAQGNDLEILKKFSKDYMV
jgi:hydroxypyruvate isomerase